MSDRTVGMPNEPVQPVEIDRGVERVFVGIPDTLPNDQLIRLHALTLASGQNRLRIEDGDDARIIATAERFAAFIADGTVAPPAAGGGS